MRITTSTAVLVVITWLAACTNSEGAGAEAAKREAEAELKKKAAQPSTTRKMAPPVPGRKRIPCEQLIDPAGFTEALGEKQPLVVKDITSSFAEATSACSLTRGGRPPSPKEQEALLKRKRRLGVLPGDEVCNVTAKCWVMETEEHLRQRCKAMKFRDDESMGTYACLQVVATGADDVYSFQFLDEDTRCVLHVRGGPSMVDNAVITSCARAARDLIGRDQIKVDGAGTEEPAVDTAQ